MKICNYLLKYDIISLGEKMKSIECIDIQDLIQQNIDINKYIFEIYKIMEKKYPNFCNWFNNKLLKGLDNGTRNIIILTQNNKVIGFVNLKKTDKERKMSNLYVNSIFYYEKCLNLLVDEATKWLEDEYPVVIISKQEIAKCSHLLINRNWYLTDRTKNNDYVMNRYDEFENFKRYFKQKKVNVI